MLLAIDHLLDADLMRSDDASGAIIAFAHPLIQAAIYAQLPIHGRAQLHTAAARCLDDEWAQLRHRAAAVSTTDEQLAR